MACGCCSAGNQFRKSASFLSCSIDGGVCVSLGPLLGAQGFYDPTTDGDFDFTAAFGYFNSTEMHLGAPPLCFFPPPHAKTSSGNDHPCTCT